MRIENVEFFPLSQRQEDPTWSLALANYPVIDGWIIVLHAEGATRSTRIGANRRNAKDVK